VTVRIGEQLDPGLKHDRENPITHVSQTPARATHDIAFTGTQRFRLVRRLGAGGGGVVYEAFDREQGTRVALKVLHSVNAEALLRFKNEFRAVQNLHHPNLVTLGELIEENGQWFFTMEFVDGVDFLSWVRSAREASEDDVPTQKVRVPRDAGSIAWLRTRPPRPSAQAAQPRFDELRLRAALPQLVSGLAALHAAGKVHRDIKPSNIRLTQTGRVVILDFGLVLDLERPTHVTRADHIVGTAEYMAPEQADSTAIGPAADWYSVGVVLFEALTGRLPFVGRGMEVVLQKQAFDPAPPRAIVPWVPHDLDALCADLLRRDPAQRPPQQEVLRRTGVEPADETAPVLAASQPAVAPRQPRGQVQLVGRGQELEELRQAFVRTRDGSAAVVYLVGQAGIGKTVLARRFAERMVSEQGAVVLAGQCYERESVPFKAMDGVIDALARFMTALPRSEAAALLPVRASLLPLVFPVLRRVPAIAEAPMPAREIADPAELRSHAFGALRELLIRLALRRPVILLIDDLQWTDAGSLSLLRELLLAEDVPPLLILATVGTGAGGALPRGSVLDPKTSLPGDVRCLEVRPLPADDACDLADLLMGAAGDRQTAALVAAEAQGHPLFIDELVRHLTQAENPWTNGRLMLDQVLWARVRELAPPLRGLVELLAVADSPLPQDAAAEACGLDFPELARVAGQLRAANLIRTSGARKADTIELYHERVRMAVGARMDQGTRANCHARLALALEASGDLERLAAHWRAAGRPERAAEYAARAAARAADTLAFDRAVQMYRLALELGPPADLPRALLLPRLAEALANAGRAAEAAGVYVEAAEAHPGDEVELRRRAGNQLLLAGRLEEGLALLRQELVSANIPLGGSLPSLVLLRARVRLSGARFRARAEDQVPPAQLRAVDLCYSLAAGLYVDPLAAAHVQARHVLHALKSGEPYRVARALAGEAIVLAGRGQRQARRAAFVLERARAIAERSENPHGVAMVHAAGGITAFLQGRFRAAREALREAEHLLAERCIGVAWELATARTFLLRSQYYLGELGELAARLPPLRREAGELGNVYAATELCSGILVSDWLAQDDVESARAASELALARMAQQRARVVQHSHVLASAQIALYEGAGREAWEEVLTLTRGAEAAFRRIELTRVQLADLRARCAVAAAAADRADRERLLGEAGRAARHLERERAPWAAPLALLTRAALAEAGGDREQAIGHLAAAALGFEELDMMLHAQVARRRKALLLGGEAGRALAASVEAWMNRQGIRSPARMCALLAPSVG
jgi:hypothetical protein